MSRKAVALGCAVVFVLIALAGAAGFYLFVWKPGSAMVRTGMDFVESGKDFTAGFARLGEIADLDRGIEDDSPYEAPADRVLTAGQVERFLAVQEQVRTEMGTRFDQAVERNRDLGESGRDVRPQDLAAALKDFGDLAVEAKRVQVAAVNDQGFSRQEYSWVKQQVYLALGLGNASAVDMGELMRAVKEGDFQGLPERASAEAQPAVPPANVELVEPHREELTRWMPLAMMGL